MISRRAVMVMMCAGVTLGDTALMPAAFADTGAQSADGLIRGMGSEAVKVLADSAMTEPQREAEFHRLLLAAFDLDTVSRLVLGRFWREATDAQKSEFRSVFENYVARTYAQRLGGHYEGETFKVGGTRPAEGGDVMVQSEIDRPNGQPIRVEWRTRKEDAGYRIIDVVVNGVSMMQTQRDEFASVIQNNGGNVDALVNRLRQQTASEG